MPAGELAQLAHARRREDLLGRMAGRPQSGWPACCLIEAVHSPHRAARRSSGSARAGAPRSQESVQHRVQRFGIAAQEVAQPLGAGKHPLLAHRQRREDLADEMRRRLSGSWQPSTTGSLPLAAALQGSVSDPDRCLTTISPPTRCVPPDQEDPIRLFNFAEPIPGPGGIKGDIHLLPEERRSAGLRLWTRCPAESVRFPEEVHSASRGHL